jgi:hypothetical protein
MSVPLRPWDGKRTPATAPETNVRQSNRHAEAALHGSAVRTRRCPADGSALLESSPGDPRPARGRRSAAGNDAARIHGFRGSRPFRPRTKPQAWQYPIVHTP